MKKAHRIMNGLLTLLHVLLVLLAFALIWWYGWIIGGMFALLLVCAYIVHKLDKKFQRELSED